MTTPDPNPYKRDRSNRKSWNTLARRRWAYGVLVAAAAVVVTHGIATTEQIASYLALGAAVLGIGGLAVANPTKDQ